MTETIRAEQDGSAPEAAREAISGKPAFDRYRVPYLAYLLFYPVPWLFHGNATIERVLGSMAAVAVFLLLYFAPYRRDRLFGLPEIVAAGLLGPAASWTHGDWDIFNVYATCMCVRLQGSERGRFLPLAVIALLQIWLVGFAWLDDKSVLHAAITALFSILLYLGTWMQWKLTVQNRQLREAQHEIRALAAVAERERIARDIHDLLGHSLTVISVKAELAGRLFDTKPERARAEVADIAQAARTSLREIREAVAGMNGASLRHELERARKALEAAGITVTVHDGGGLDVSPENEAPGDGVPGNGAPGDGANGVLAMALREAVTNVIRHSGARSCAIRFDRDASGAPCAVRVEDDGATWGANQEAEPLEGNGLRGMRARLAAAGGSLDLARTGSGMSLTARVAP